MYSVSIVSHTLAQRANEKQASQAEEAERVGPTAGSTEEGASLIQTALLLRADSVFERKKNKREVATM